MSNVVVQIGQCGNQLGFQFCDLLLNEISVTADTVFNQDTRKARWIMVDSEPKVINAVLGGKTTPLQTAMNGDRYVCHQTGRGNNWAMGYLDSPVAGVCLHEETMNMLRREAESADYLRSILTLSSLAGGTGSGLGSRIIESIRDEYPLIHLLSTTVQPSSSGESPLQHYNSCFALSWLTEFADTIFYFQNDAIMETIKGNLPIGADIGMGNLNEYISCALYTLFYPNRNRDLDLANIIQNVCPSTDCKFVEVLTSPFLYEKQPVLPFETQWGTLVDHCLFQYSKFESPKSKNFEVQSLSVAVTYRGRDVIPDANMPKKQFTKKLKAFFKPVAWLDPSLSAEAASDKRLLDRILMRPAGIADASVTMDSVVDRRGAEKGPGKVGWTEPSIVSEMMVEERPYNVKFRIERALTIASTRTGVILPIKHTFESAFAKFNAGAYLHWYTKYNCGHDEFMQAFEKMQNLVDTYEQMTTHTEGQRRVTNSVNELFDTLLSQSSEQRSQTVRTFVPTKEREYKSTRARKK